ncbi:MAG: sulfotransferase family protein [Gaiellaceae bacterium]
MSPPLFVLGVRRSGTTLLRVMLDRNSQLAVPDESYFIPQLAERHRGSLDADAFVDDLRRLPTLREWDVPLEEVRARLPAVGDVGAAIATVYDVYAERHGKRRWGDKTPLYMQYLGLIERIFPEARYVHLIRDGRDAALSFLEMPRGIVTETWAHPRGAAGVACQWRTEVAAARRLGARVGPRRYLEVRYEALVNDPEGVVREICRFADLPYESEMLEYPGSVDLSAKPHQRSLAKAPTPGLRDWRTQMAAPDLTTFEHVAGDLLSELGYEISRPAAHGPDLYGRFRLASYGTRMALWRGTGFAVRRSPLWRRRHPLLV